MGIRLQVAAATVAALVAGGAVGAWQSSEPKVFGASAQMVVQPSPQTLAVAGARPDNLVFLARTYAAHFGTRPTMQAAIARAALDISPDTGLRRTAVSVSNTDATINIETTGPTKADARALNDALTQVVTSEINTEQSKLRDARLAPLDQQISDLQSQIASAPAGSAERATAQQTYQTLVATRAQTLTQPSDQLAVLSPAQAGSGPVAPHPVRNGALALLVVAAVAAQLIVWRAARRRRTPPAGSPAGLETHRTMTSPVMVNPADAPAASVVDSGDQDSAITRMARRKPAASTRTTTRTQTTVRTGTATRATRTPTRRTPKPRVSSVEGAEIAEGA